MDPVEQASMDEDGRLRTVYLSISPRGQRTEMCSQTVHLMDGFRRRTIKNIEVWTEVDGWTDGRKSVRRRLQ